MEDTPQYCKELCDCFSSRREHVGMFYLFVEEKSRLFISFSCRFFLFLSLIFILFFNTRNSKPKHFIMIYTKPRSHITCTASLQTRVLKLFFCFFRSWLFAVMFCLSCQEKFRTREKNSFTFSSDMDVSELQS